MNERNGPEWADQLRMIADRVRRPNIGANDMKTMKTVAMQTVLPGLVLAWANLQAAAAVLRVPAEYNTIQAAVDAAVSGDEICIVAGTYTEQVMITSKNLSLVGEPGAVLKAFPGMSPVTLPQNPPLPVLLGIVFCDDVRVRGLTLDGARLAASPGLLGVVFHGSSGRIKRCTIKGFRDPALRDGVGLGAGNWASLNRELQRVQVLNNNFEDNWHSMTMVAGGDPNP